MTAFTFVRARPNRPLSPGTFPDDVSEVKENP